MEGQLRERSDQIIAEAKSVRQRLLAANDWKSLGESNDMQGFQREEGDTVFVKGVAIINFPPNVIADFIWNNDNRSKYEDFLGSVNILHNFGDTKIELIHKKMPLIISDREILHVIRRENEGENVLIISRSIDLDVPVVEGRVRATSHILSYYLVNIEDIAAEVTLIIGANPNGSIPQVLLSQIAGKAAFQLAKIRDALSG
jgi:hypothetical protein